MDPTYRVLATKSSHLTLQSFWEGGRHCIFIIPQIIFTLSSLLLILCITRKKKVIIESLSLSLMARCTLRAITITSWIVSMQLFAQHFLITYYVEGFIEHEPFLQHFQDFFKMQTKLLYAQFISFCTVAIIEFPPLLIISSQIYIKLNSESTAFLNVQLRYNKALIIVKVAIFSLGFIGIILYIQIQLVFTFNALIFLLIEPLFVMWKLANDAEQMLLAILTLTHLQIFIINVRKRRQCLISLIRLFITILSGTAIFLIMGLLHSIRNQIELVHYGEGLSITSTTNSIFSSIILAIVGYIFKKVIFQRVRKEMKAGRSEPERQPLIQL